MGSTRVVALGCVLLLLAACGGGGGGGDGGSNNNGNFSIATTSVTFDGDPDGATPAAAIVNGSITGVNQTVFLEVVTTSNGVANVSVALTSETTGQLTIFPKSPAQLGFGTFTDTITVRACLNAGCSQQIPGSPKTITVTYNVSGLRSTPTSATLSATEGAASAAAQVTLTNNTTSNWTSSIVYVGATSGWLTVTPTSAATQGAQQLTFNASALTTPGSYSATVRITAGNRTLDLPVTYNVTPNLGLSQPMATLTAVSGQTAPPVGANVNVTAASGATTFATSVSYGAGASNWLATAGTSAPGTLSLVPQSVALAPGSYTATVTLTPNGSGTPVAIAVTYTLAPTMLTLAPTDPVFEIGAASTATAQFLQRTIATGDTGAPITWTASSSVPWLTVTPVGNSGLDAVLSLIPSELEGVRNGAHQAVVTFTYNGASVVNETRQLTVDLSLSLPTIDSAMPYVAYLNEQVKELVLRGSGFNQPNGGAVTFDGAPAALARVVSDTEIRVTPPASAVTTASRPVIAIENALNLDRSDSELFVRAKPDYGTQQFAFNIGAPSGPRVLYDAERDVLFVLRTGTIDPPAETSDSVMRFALDPDGVDPPVFSSRQLLFVSDIGLSPDGKTLYAVTNTELHFLSPDDLSSLKPPVTVPSLSGLAGRMAVINTGEILFPHMQRMYSPRTGEFKSIAGAVSDTETALSADGSQVALQPLNGAGKVFLGLYDAGVDAFRFQTEDRFSSPLSVDRNGTFFAHGGDVFNTAALSLIGSAGDNGYFSVLSPGGERLYAITFSPSRVRVWDTSSFGTFPELPSINVPFGVNAMGISLNGEHLFIIDASNLFVVEP